MANYSQMTNAELRRELAERLGWFDLRWHNWNQLVGGKPGHITPGNDREAIVTPNWPESLDACWRELTPPSGIHLEIDTCQDANGNREIVAMMLGLDNENPPVGIDDEPARAWSIAYLKLDDARLTDS